MIIIFKVYWYVSLKVILWIRDIKDRVGCNIEILLLYLY